MAAATYQISAPEAFCFSNPGDWPKWRKRFERFRLASGLDTGSEEKQVNELIYLMGEQAEDVFLSFGLTIEEQKEYNTVIERFESYFIRKRNVIFERAKFNRRVQTDGESVQAFITTLHALAEHCDYGALHDELIRDRIVVGVCDTKLSDRLQLIDDLTLERAINMARQSEEVKQQTDFVRGPKQELPSGVNKIQVKHKQKVLDKQKFTEKSEFRHKTTFKTTPCCWCGGKFKHTREQCPASGQECRKCKKKGHYQKVCRSLSRAEVKGINDINDSVFLGNLTSAVVGQVETVEPPWTISICVNNIPVIFEVDTGADVTVIPERVYRQLLSTETLQPSNRVIAGATQEQFSTLGMIQATLKYKGRNTQQIIYVVKGLRAALLGRQAVMELHLVQLIRGIQSASPTTVDPVREFPKLFTGLGRLEQPHHIQLKPNASPYALYTPRRVPLPQMAKLKAELDKMVQSGVITPVEKPTDWCAPMVIVTKPSGDLRVCVDLTELNRNVLRETHPMPVVEHTLGQLQGAKYFSKLDANAGFWQVPLTPESALLTTFITPFGRFHFNRLPFGITSAPEHFQRRMNQILQGLDGVAGHNDDTLVHGATESEHDIRLRKVLERLQAAGMTLNKDKCQFKSKQVKFLGHIVDSNGIHLDPEKLDAILHMQEPTSVTEVKRFVGMTNYLGKFVPHLADIQKPITALLSSKVEWMWGPPQKKAFKEVKESLTMSPVLALYDTRKETFISADASAYGIGCVLLQKQEDGHKRPIAYASRTLTECEKRYAQIEKEALAQVWACEKFHDYILGLTVSLETDHLPLVPIFTSKHLDDLTPRLQRMRIRMMRYSYTIYHTPGKDLLAADALSREPLPNQQETDLEADIGAYVKMVTTSWPASKQGLERIKQEQHKDAICISLAKYSCEGWPKKNNLELRLQEYWQHRHSIVQQEGILTKGMRIVIPKSLQEDTLNRIHEGHQGITKCRARARESVWWPGLSTQINDRIRQCSICTQHVKNRHEPLLPSKFPERPWQKAALDLYKLQGNWYLIVSDYYSRYFEIAKMQSLTSREVIEHTKSVFARHGIPEQVYSDQGSQFGVLSTSEFREFANDYGFEHHTSSARFTQSNGFIEAAVKVAKMRIKKSGDPYRALLAYRTTPLANGFSPAELCMNRKLRSTVPTLKSLLDSRIPPKSILRQRENSLRADQAFYYNRRHGVRPLTPLKTAQPVWVTDANRPGIIVAQKDQPRSYKIRSGESIIDRNRFHLIPAAQDLHRFQDLEERDLELDEIEYQTNPAPKDVNLPASEKDRCSQTVQPSESTPAYTTRSGRIVRKPNKLNL